MPNSSNTDEIEKILIKYDEKILNSGGASKRAWKSARRRAIEDLLIKAQARTLSDFVGWVDRIHRQPVNDSDRWSIAAGEIILEANNRIEQLQQLTKNGDSDETH